MRCLVRVNKEKEKAATSDWLFILVCFYFYFLFSPAVGCFVTVFSQLRVEVYMGLPGVVCCGVWL